MQTIATFKRGVILEEFTQKLHLIYTEMYDEDMDQFTEAFIDYDKFNSNKNTKEEFFTNRKILLRRWLKGTRCTSDFQKSFRNYKISNYRFGIEQLFRLEDFRIATIGEFEKKLNAYLKEKQKAHIPTEYQYIYLFNELDEVIEPIAITDWIKGERGEVKIALEYKDNHYRGTFAFHDTDNIFITMSRDSVTYYLLFHDNRATNTNYIVGTAMGHLPTDNHIPHAQKAILAKDRVTDTISLQFILNEAETISAIENRFNPTLQEVKISPFVRYHTQFKKYHKLFSRLLSKKFRQNFYYRLAFREFYAFKRLFEKVSKEESYFVFNHYRAFFELVKTLEEIKDTSLYIVREFNENSLFLDSNYKIREIKERFFGLSSYGIDTTIIFVVESLDALPQNLQAVLEEMKKRSIEVRLVIKDSIINEVNSLDFAFIHMGDKRDFVLADPLRDSKDVFKLFVDEITMDEYRIDYEKILEKSRKF